MTRSRRAEGKRAQVERPPSASLERQTKRLFIGFRENLRTTSNDSTFPHKILGVDRGGGSEWHFRVEICYRIFDAHVRKYSKKNPYENFLVRTGEKG